jgi:hypothetical protein
VLVRPQLQPAGNQILPPCFKPWFWPATAQVISFMGLTTAGALANVWDANAAGANARMWYFAEAALTVGHAAFVPWIEHKVLRILDNKGDNVQDLTDWLAVNRVQGLTVDLGAWMCCLVAVAKTMA